MEIQCLHEVFSKNTRANYFFNFTSVGDLDAVGRRRATAWVLLSHSRHGRKVRCTHAVHRLCAVFRVCLRQYQVVPRLIYIYIYIYFCIHTGRDGQWIEWPVSTVYGQSLPYCAGQIELRVKKINYFQKCAM